MYERYSFKKISWFIYVVLLFTQIPVVMAETDEVANKTIQSIVHALDYVAVDYPGVISNGKVINDTEYAEQVEIIQHALSLISELPDDQYKNDLFERAQAIQQAIDKKVPGEEVALLSHMLITAFIDSYQVKTSPSFTPSLAAGQQLYQSHCVACHGLMV